MKSRPFPYPGRGALSNPEGRFESRRVEEMDDGWQPSGDGADELPPLQTTVTAERAKSILTRNDSPDVGFDVSINPYRGCEHGCVYCMSGETRVLLGNGQTKALADLVVGDQICGTRRTGHYRALVRTTVLAHWATRKRAYRVVLADGTQLKASGDHRFLTERGWKFVARDSRIQRPHLTINNSLLGMGTVAAPARLATANDTAEFRRGYLCGVIRGDGLLGSYSYRKRPGGGATQHQFRLALADFPALDRSAAYLAAFGIATQRAPFGLSRLDRKSMQQIRTSTGSNFAAIRSLIAWPVQVCTGWAEGYLSGLFDAEGSYSEGTLRIANSDSRLLQVAKECLGHHGFGSVIETSSVERTRPMHYLRITGGLREHLRFFRTCRPAIERKCSILGQRLKSTADLRVVSIEPLPGEMDLFDITTGTGDFIANGTVSHNCYARPDHSYVNLSPGLDFETKLFYKDGAAALLETELRCRSYVCKPINIGASTDPYQPAERRLRVTRSLLEVLARFRHPVTIVTKSALIERDLDLLVDLARDDLVNVFVSVTTLESQLKRTLEPRAPSPAARLRAVRSLHDSGVPVGVLVAPIIPAVNDSEIERIVEAAANAGARTCGYVVLRLPWEVKDLFREWLEAHLPLRAAHVMALVNEMRSGKDNDPRFGTRMKGEGPIADLIRVRFNAACRRSGLQRPRDMPLSTAHFRVPPEESPQLALW
jgi:DNA repair photolyase